MMKKIVLLFLVCFSFVLAQPIYSQEDDWFTIVYSNVPSNPDLKTDWGFSAWISLNNEVILFDTGNREEILSENLKKLNLDPAKISMVVISHDHLDHTGGLEMILKQVRENTLVYLPNDFNPGLKTAFPRLKFVVNDKFVQIKKGIWVTEIFMNPQNKIMEQALILLKNDKLIMITGCAHPGIAEMCETVVHHFTGKGPELVTGGFHLMNTGDEQVLRISNKIEQVGFEKTGPSHCTGDRVTSVFKELWKDRFVPLNLGDTYRF